jgi:hypothetical protein
MNLKSFDSSKKGSNLINIFYFIFKERYFILCVVLLFGVIGYIYSHLRQNSYKAKASFIQQLNNNGAINGGFGGLEKLTGINLGKASGDFDVPPQLYNEIIKSTLFSENLSKSLIFFSEKDSISVQDYFLNNFNMQNIEYIENIDNFKILDSKAFAFSNYFNNLDYNDKFNSIKTYSKDQLNVFSAINSSLELTLDEKTGLTEVSVTLNNPVVAAQILQNSMFILKEMAYKLKYSQALKSLEYTKDLYNEKKLEIDSLQNIIAVMKDRNQAISNNKNNVFLEAAQNEFNIKYSTFIDLAGQVEKAKLSVKESSASYIIIHPVTIPTTSSLISKFSLTLFSLLLGFLIALFYISMKYYFLKLRDLFLSHRNF